MTEGVRYPTFAFITGGVGQADEGIPPQPFETFCYDSALMQAKIENFNVVPYTSVLPKELFGKIVPLNDQIVKQFKHGAVLEVIMAGNGASRDNHKAIATGLGVCWGKDKNGELIGGWAAEYVEYFDTFIDDEIARGHAEMWLNKSLQHELDIRGVEKHSVRLQSDGPGLPELRTRRTGQSVASGNALPLKTRQSRNFSAPPNCLRNVR